MIFSEPMKGVSYLSRPVCPCVRPPAWLLDDIQEDENEHRDEEKAISMPPIKGYVIFVDRCVRAQIFSLVVPVVPGRGTRHASTTFTTVVLNFRWLEFIIYIASPFSPSVRELGTPRSLLPRSYSKCKLQSSGRSD